MSHTELSIQLRPYLGMSQDSSVEWISDSQFKFFDQNRCTNAVLCAQCDINRFFWVRRHLTKKLKENLLDIIMSIKAEVGVHLPTTV